MSNLAPNSWQQSWDKAPKPELREAWALFLKECGHFDAFVTIGFSTYLDVQRAVTCVNHLLVRLNRSLYTKKYRQRDMWLNGVVIMERKRKSRCAPNGLHFHMLLEGPKPLDIEELAQLVDKHSGRLRMPTGNKSRPFGRRVSGPQYVDVRSIHDSCGLADYLTKDIRCQPASLCGTNIGFISRSGVEGI